MVIAYVDPEQDDGSNKNTNTKAIEKTKEVRNNWNSEGTGLNLFIEFKFIFSIDHFLIWIQCWFYLYSISFKIT